MAVITDQFVVSTLKMFQISENSSSLQISTISTALDTLKSYNNNENVNKHDTSTVYCYYKIQIIIWQNKRINKNKKLIISQQFLYTFEKNS